MKNTIRLPRWINQSKSTRVLDANSRGVANMALAAMASPRAPFRFIVIAWDAPRGKAFSKSHRKSMADAKKSAESAQSTHIYDAVLRMRVS
jgi:hypothetical protein